VAFLRTDDMRARASRRTADLGLSVRETLRRVAQRRLERYDIFLSQTIRDAEIVLGVYDLLTSKGYAVFCDWIDSAEEESGIR